MYLDLKKEQVLEIVQILDENLKHFSNVIKEKIGKEIDSIEGAGAAGGLGAALGWTM